MNLTDRIRITNEDNMAMMARYPDKHFDLAIVDPPYGIGINASGRLGHYGGNGKKWDDTLPTTDYFAELYRISKNQIVWGANYFTMPPTRCYLIWDKQQPQGVSFADSEYAWTSLNESARTFRMRPQGADDYRIHPTQKPVALYKWLLKNYATPDMKILDTHLGSGSIAIACHEFGCDLTACELDADYYRDAIKRIQSHISQTNLFL